MTGYYMLRTFDHAGYYETRLVLTLIAVGVASWFLRRRGDARCWIMLASGVFWQGLMEYILQLLGFRGASYQLSVFGIHLSGLGANLFQGCAEGGILSLMAFWYVDLKTRAGDVSSRKAYLMVCALIVLLACLVGYLSAGRPITSARPLFVRANAIWLSITIPISLLLAAWKRGLRHLWLFVGGLLVYIVITFGPLQAMGARYIGLRDASGAFVAAPLWAQLWAMLYSHLMEVAGGKIHYFAVPFALGLTPIGRQPAMRTTGSD